jgi:preprotein translocase subunit SecE
MGRLQRKKASNKTKRKKQRDNSRSGAISQTTNGEKKSIAAVTAQKEPARRPTESQKKSAPVSKTMSGENIVGKSIQFLREVKVELKKVTWPSRKQTMGSTLVVIILVMVISLFLGVVDLGLSGIIRVVLQ